VANLSHKIKGSSTLLIRDVPEIDQPGIENACLIVEWRLPCDYTQRTADHESNRTGFDGIPPSARPDRYLARSQTRLETYQVGPVVQSLSLEGHPTRFGEVERVSAVRWQGYLLPSNIWSQA
jgi:hypothetical protein